MRRCLVILTLVYGLHGAVVIDRIAAVVGKHIIKASDIDRDLRVTEFLNREPLNLNADAKRKAADRLIDQAIIRDEIANEGYNRATDSEAETMLKEIRQSRYGGSDARLRQALTQYGLTEAELQSQLLWQLTVLRFIDERFRPGILVTEEEQKTYYDQHIIELRREYPRDSSFEALQPKIQSSLEGERINEQFTSWLDETRKSNRIEFKQGAFE